MQFTHILTAVVVLASTLPVAAQTPRPHASSSVTGAHRVPTTTFQNPRGRKTNPGTMNGAGCNSGPTAVRAQNSVNPITGKAQAKTIVSIPLGKGAGSVASSTTRHQQAVACAHTR